MGFVKHTVEVMMEYFIAYNKESKKFIKKIKENNEST